jgi:hypothetical protein
VKFQKSPGAIKFNFAPPALKAWRISILPSAIPLEIFPRLCECGVETQKSWARQADGAGDLCMQLPGNSVF